MPHISPLFLTSSSNANCKSEMLRSLTRHAFTVLDFHQTKPRHGATLGLPICVVRPTFMHVRPSNIPLGEIWPKSWLLGGSRKKPPGEQETKFPSNRLLTIRTPLDYPPPNHAHIMMFPKINYVYLDALRFANAIHPLQQALVKVWGSTEGGLLPSPHHNLLLINLSD